MPWPREWPESVRPYLAASEIIQSDDAVFKTFIEKTTDGRLRRTPIYVAAKELVRSTILQFRNVEGGSLYREGDGRIVGFQLQGAVATTAATQVTPADMVCACVAVLRRVWFLLKDIFERRFISSSYDKRIAR